jgi:hypothetical protein
LGTLQFSQFFLFAPIRTLLPPQFDLFANTISDSFKFRVKAIFEGNRALSRSITSSALEVRHHSDLSLWFFSLFKKQMQMQRVSG